MIEGSKGAEPLKFWMLATSSRSSNCGGMSASNQTSKAGAHGDLLHGQLWATCHFFFFYSPISLSLDFENDFSNPINNFPNFGFQIILNLKKNFILSFFF